WPLHAHEEDIEKYKGRFDEGWDVLREKRMKRMKAMGIIDNSWDLSDRDPSQPAWEEASDKEWRLRCMEVYAAQIDRMDQGIGRIMDSLKNTGQLDNTLVIFLSDNGACAEDVPSDVTKEEMVDQLQLARDKTRRGEEVLFGNRPDVMPGAENTYQSYETAWANLSNSPFRLYKHWIHEGGISTPLIMSWPEGIKEKGVLRHSPGQLPDIMATILDITGSEYPETYNGHEIHTLEGSSLMSIVEDDTPKNNSLFWEHEGNAGIREGQWKLVRDYPGDWELYDMANDRTELMDVAHKHPEKVAAMADRYNEWANRCGVIPREKILELMRRDSTKKAFWEKDV